MTFVATKVFPGAMRLARKKEIFSSLAGRL